MKLVKELLDYEKGPNELQCFIFTANSTLDRNRNLVMGAGNALACKKAFPYAPNEFGRIIEDQSEFYLASIHADRGMLMAFQTKVHWKRKTPLDLLETSVASLRTEATENPDWQYHLPCPGVNNGGLSVDKVMPLLETLPDNVIVYLA